MHKDLVLLFPLVLACAEDLRQTTDTGPRGDGGAADGGTSDGGADGDGGGDGGGTGGDGGGTGGDGGGTGGLATVQLDASGADWVPYDLDSGAQAEAGWDLSFLRYNVRLDGGVSGGGGVEVAILAGADPETLTLAEVQALGAGEWITDQADADGDGNPEYAMGDWYDYDSSTHVLTPKDRVYAVRTNGGAVVAVQMLSYYDDAGTSGHPTFAWRTLEAR